MPDWGVTSHETWAVDQLKHAGLSSSGTAAVRRLLKVFWEAGHPADETELLLKTFNELALNHAIEPPEADWVWVPVRPGQIFRADIVRVKLDAYQGNIGQLHNGRVCKVVAMRSGDIIVNSIDDGMKIEGAHHSPFALDKRYPRG